MDEIGQEMEKYELIRQAIRYKINRMEKQKNISLEILLFNIQQEEEKQNKKEIDRNISILIKIMERRKAFKEVFNIINEVEVEKHFDKYYRKK